MYVSMFLNMCVYMYIKLNLDPGIRINVLFCLVPENGLCLEGKDMDLG